MPEPDSMKSDGHMIEEGGHGHSHGHGGKRCTLGLSSMCLVLVALVATFVVWLFSVNQAGQISHAEKKAFLSTLGTAHTTFGIVLLRNLIGQETANVFVSPLSLSMGLAMTSRGASDRGQAEIFEVLQLAQVGDEATIASLYQQMLDYMASKDSSITMSIANAVWTSATVNPAFTTALQTYFGASVFPLTTAAAINAWVKDKTRGLIPTTLDSLDSSLALLLLNVVYFKSPWKVSFDPQYTTPQKFTTPSGAKLVDMMHMSAEDFIYKSTPAYQMLALPYGKGTDYYAYIILPQDGVTMRSILLGLNPTSFAGLARMGGTLSLPRIKLAFTQHMNTVLQAMGVQAVFQSNELTRLSDDPSLAVGDVFHRAVVDLNEGGTEAAAVTGVGMTRTAPIDAWFSMVVDRPFILAIRLIITGDTLFLGYIADPQPAS